MGEGVFIEFAGAIPRRCLLDDRIDFAEDVNRLAPGIHRHGAMTTEHLPGEIAYQLLAQVPSELLLQLGKIGEVAEVVALSEKLGLDGALQQQGEDVVVVVPQPSGSDETFFDALRHRVGGEIAHQVGELVPVHGRWQRLDGRAVSRSPCGGGSRHHQGNQAVFGIVSTGHVEAVHELRDVVAAELVAVRGDVGPHVTDDQGHRLLLRYALSQHDCDCF